jgi:hypothetical protein
MAYLLVLKSRLYHRPNKLSRGAYRTDLSSKPPSASSKHCVQTLAVVLNRLQEEPLNVGRGAPFLSRHFRPLGHEGVAAFL